MPVSTEVLGPGTLQIGAVASEIDASCLVNNAKITMTKDQADSTKKLCGDEAPGAVTYTFSLTGNVDQDLATATGLHHLSWTAAGTAQPFSYTPSTSVGAEAVGTITIDPLDFGGDEMGADMTSDFEWSCVGKPVITYGTGVVGTGTEAVGDGDEEAA